LEEESVGERMEKGKSKKERNGKVVTP